MPLALLGIAGAVGKGLLHVQERGRGQEMLAAWLIDDLFAAGPPG